MNPHIQQYLSTVSNRLKAGTATEHTYRGDLQILLEALAPGIVATNEPKRQACGAPDYILTKNNIPVGYIEAKDIVGVNLDKTEKTDQLKRYRTSLENLLLTDYLEFRYFKAGEKITSVSLAKLAGNTVVPQPENWPAFENLITEFTTHVSQTIKSAAKLAEMMAGKARLMQTVIENALTADVKAIENEEDNNPETELYKQFLAFKEVLLHDIKPAEFADIYAQTIAYGMFAARLHDPTLPTFSRYEAAQLIPQTNPFLRKLFQYIAGYDLDQRLAWIVDALADVFRATDVAAILKNFGRSTQTHDPIIHFYETFLSEYNPALRKSRGVWYTPEPVVNFIVRAVDDILKTEFNLPDGLASTETTEIEVDVQHKKTKGRQTVHKVQVLDPATGTGTFLAEVIKHVYQQFEGQEGIWSQYVEKHLLPRLNGFEILMASYAMCHLKLDLLLTETGYQPQNPKRFKVYLTNSLEEAAPSQLSLFASWLSDEAMQANAVKRDTPVMVVLGNPPYSVISTNKGKWIQKLIADYKVGLNERKINLDDDYIKFIRYAEHFIEKTGQGVVAMITNNSFIDGITHRQMRKHLLETFDKIFILDLHGNSKKKEVSPDGSVDQNVFDIMQGVSINIFTKTGVKAKKELGEIYHSELFGKSEVKYKALIENSVKSIEWKKIKITEPDYYFIPQDLDVLKDYKTGLSLTEIFLHFNSGIQTKRDDFTIHNTPKELKNVIDSLLNNETAVTRIKYDIAEDGRDWQINLAKEDIRKGYQIIDILYRPFDSRFTAYTGRSKGFLAYPRSATSCHYIGKDNVGLISCRQTKSNAGAFISKNPIDQKVFSAYDINSMFPLYLYPESKEQTQLAGLSEERVPNLDPKIVAKIAQNLKLQFVPEKTGETGTFAPIDLLDYIYAVLHSPAYRERYKEFLKIDFPRVPYPTNAEQFWQLAALGAELRQLHLLEHPAVNKFITKYPESGTNIVEKPRFVMYDYAATLPGEPTPDYLGDVFINETQYFAGVPTSAWEFYIGGYQPAQKWLKDRKGRELQHEDIRHYQRIIVALQKTAELMQLIDEVLELEGVEVKEEQG